jgi:hypothetical protein
MERSMFLTIRLRWPDYQQLRSEGLGEIDTAVAFDYAVILSPWLGGWLVTRKRAEAVLRLIA